MSSHDPGGLRAAIVHLRAGDWQRAHTIVQEDASDLGAWAHGIVHILEGDDGNARYWYRRAGRAFPAGGDAAAEVAALEKAIDERGSP